MKKIVSIIIISCAIIILGYLLITLLISKSSQRTDSPFKFNLEDFNTVDKDLISHKEIRQISLPDNEYIDLFYYKNKIYLLSKNKIKVISPEGAKISEIKISKKPTAFTICKEALIYICFQNYILIYDIHGEIVKESHAENERSFFSSIAVGEDEVFVADAGLRQVIVYDKDLIKQTSFAGESGVSDVHGFIIPSNHFALALDTDMALWVVNPGLHAIQNYSYDGRLRGYWSKTSYQIDGFSGCCNPFYLKFLPNGNMLTSEKGLVRVKIHKESGEFVSVVAPPKKFKTGGVAPAITIDENDNVIILDFDNNMIRFFNKKDTFED